MGKRFTTNRKKSIYKWNEIGEIKEIYSYHLIIGSEKRLTYLSGLINGKLCLKC